jgi:hypothetical protein
VYISLESGVHARERRTHLRRPSHYIALNISAYITIYAYKYDTYLILETENSVTVLMCVVHVRVTLDECAFVGRSTALDAHAVALRSASSFSNAASAHTSYAVSEFGSRAAAHSAVDAGANHSALMRIGANEVLGQLKERVLLAEGAHLHSASAEC